MTQVKKVPETTTDTNLEVPKHHVSACAGVILLGRRQEPWPVLWAPRSWPLQEPPLKRSARTKQPHRKSKAFNPRTRTV